MQILDVFLHSQAYSFVPLVPLQKPPRVWSSSVMADLLLWLQGTGKSVCFSFIYMWAPRYGFWWSWTKLSYLLKPSGEGVCGQKILTVSKNLLNYAHFSSSYFKGHPWQPTDCSACIINGLCRCCNLNWLPGFLEW